MQLSMFQVDAFSDRLFAGNPAAVCLLPHWLDDATLASIAAENNLSETAFIVDKGDDWELRWFTPTAEVDLCGHATLAAGFVLFRTRPMLESITFHTRFVGEVRVLRRGHDLVLDFPARPPSPIETPAGLVEALGGVTPTAVLKAAKMMAVFEDERTVRALTPDLAYVAAMDSDGLIVTAPGDTADFVSRYFAPHVGIDEDPVTGSAHCTLTPYWAERLKRRSLHAQQVSQRGGELTCTMADNDKVQIAGKAVLYLEGTIYVDDTQK